MAKADQKGRSPGSRFARLDHRLLSSPAYRALSPNARSLLVELAMMENGKNNGALFLSVRDAAHRMGVSDPKTAGAAFDELRDLGFADLVADAHFAVKAGDGSRARVWRLTWQAVAGKRGPSCEYEQREPAPKTLARRRMERGLKALKRWKQEQPEEKSAVVNFPTHMPERVGKSPTTMPDQTRQFHDRVGKFPTRFLKNGRKPPNVVVGDFPTHTAVPAGSANGEPSIGWWANDRMAQATIWAAAVQSFSSMEQAA